MTDQPYDHGRGPLEGEGGEKSPHSMSDDIAPAPARDRAGRGGTRPNPGMGGLQRKAAIRKLRKRDGDRCCFGIGCAYGGQPLDFVTPRDLIPEGERPTIEHRKEWSRSRSHKLAHLALAHNRCNQHHGRLYADQRAREGQLFRKIGQISAWPALTYADELDFK